MELQYQMDQPLIGGLAPNADDLMQEIGFVQRHGALMRPGDLVMVGIDAEAGRPGGRGIAQSEWRATHDAGEGQRLLALAQADGFAREHEAEDLAPAIREIAGPQGPAFQNIAGTGNDLSLPQEFAAARQAL